MLAAATDFSVHVFALHAPVVPGAREAQDATEPVSSGDAAVVAVNKAYSSYTFEYPSKMLFFWATPVAAGSADRLLMVRDDLTWREFHVGEQRMTVTGFGRLLKVDPMAVFRL